MGISDTSWSPKGQEHTSAARSLQIRAVRPKVAPLLPLSLQALLPPLLKTPANRRTERLCSQNPGLCCKELLCTELFVCLRMLILNTSFLCLQLQKALVQSDVNFLTSRQCTHEIPRVFSNLNASRWHWSSSRKDASSLQYDFRT